MSIVYVTRALIVHCIPPSPLFRFRCLLSPDACLADEAGDDTCIPVVSPGSQDDLNTTMQSMSVHTVKYLEGR